MPQVPKQKTPLSRMQLVEALRDGYFAAFGQTPSSKTLGVAFAQNALENASGQAIWCNNFGNITAAKAWKDAGKDYYTLHVAERPDPQGHPDLWKQMDLDFRVYATPAEGAKGYWQLLASSYYKVVLDFFAAGDPSGAAYKLSALHYFTAHVEDTVDSRGNRVPGYASNMVAYYKIFTDALLPNLPPWTEPGTAPVCAVPDEGGDVMRCLITMVDAQEISQEALALMMDAARNEDYGARDLSEDEPTGGGNA